MTIQFSDFARSTLTAGIAAATTAPFTITVEDGTKFYAYDTGDYEYLVLKDASGNREVIEVSGRTGNTLTVAARALGKTTARDWLIGSYIEACPISHAMLDMLALITAAQTTADSKFASAGGTITGDVTIDKGTATVVLKNSANAIVSQTELARNSLGNGVLHNGPDGHLPVFSYTQNADGSVSAVNIGYGSGGHPINIGRSGSGGPIEAYGTVVNLHALTYVLARLIAGDGTKKITLATDDVTGRILFGEYTTGVEGPQINYNASNNIMAMSGMGQINIYAPIGLTGSFSASGDISTATKMTVPSPVAGSNDTTVPNTAWSIARMGETLNAANSHSDSALSGHTSASDPHPQYLTPAEGDSRYAAYGTVAGVTSVQVQYFNIADNSSLSAETDLAVSSTSSYWAHRSYRDTFTISGGVLIVRYGYEHIESTDPGSGGSSD